MIEIVERKKKPILESQIQKQFKEWLDKQPDLHHWKTNDQYTRGVSDMIICISGIFLAIELKVPGKEPSQLQADFIKKIISKGGIACWCDTVKQCISVVEYVRTHRAKIAENIKKEGRAGLLITKSPDGNAMNFTLDF